LDVGGDWSQKTKGDDEKEKQILIVGHYFLELSHSEEDLGQAIRHV
jgi:hypothetical protein